MEPLEIEYMELISIPNPGKVPGFQNKRFGLRIKTTPATYEKDFADLIIEVKTRLQELVQENRENNKKEIKK